MSILKVFITMVFLTTVAFTNETIVVQNDDLFPESISYDKKSKRFFVSSLNKGEIWSVAKDGTKSLFVRDKRIISAFGVLVDDTNNRLLVCVSDIGIASKSSKATTAKLAVLIIYDIESKKELFYHDLSSLHTKPTTTLLNGVTLDNTGNIYVTDSFSPRIYKIDTDGKAKIWIESDSWKSSEGQFGLNGITYHPNGFIIVSHYETKTLYKIDIKVPKKMQKIEVKNNVINGVDGMLLTNSKTLYVVNNNFSGVDSGNGVYKLQSTDNWKTAEVVKSMLTGTTSPTSLTQKEDDVYLLHSKILYMFGGSNEESKSFEIEKISFK